MANNLYTRSLTWLVAIGGVGYGLMLLTAPSAEKLEKIKASSSSTHLTAEEKKKLLFMKRLKEATREQPIYLQKKEETKNNQE